MDEEVALRIHRLKVRVYREMKLFDHGSEIIWYKATTSEHTENSNCGVGRQGVWQCHCRPLLFKVLLPHERDN